MPFSFKLLLISDMCFLYFYFQTSKIRKKMSLSKKKCLLDKYNSLRKKLSVMSVLGCGPIPAGASTVHPGFCCESPGNGRGTAGRQRREASATGKPSAVAGQQSIMGKPTVRILIFNPPLQTLDIIIPPAEHPQCLQPSLPDKKYQKK